MIKITEEHARALLMANDRRPLDHDDDRDAKAIEALMAVAEGLHGADKQASRRRRQWGRGASSLKTIAMAAAPTIANAAAIDIIGAHLRETFIGNELSIDDEETLYVAVVVCGIIVNMATRSFAQGTIPREGVETVGVIAATFVAALSPHFPPEARPDGA